jgi:hypothetical protein
VFPPQTNDFQKPIKFVSTSGKVFFGKESEKESEEKSGEKPSEEKPVEKPSGEKPSEQPQPKPKLKLVRFLSYVPPWAHYLSGYQDRLLGGPLGLLNLGCTTPVGMKRKDLGGEVLG